MTTGTTDTTVALRGGWAATPVALPPPPQPPKAKRCKGRVGRRRCRCMTTETWCHRHRKQMEAYFLRLHKPWTADRLMTFLAGKALVDWELEGSEYDPASKTLTLRDWDGGEFTLAITKHKRAPSFKDRLAKRMAQRP